MPNVPEPQKIQPPHVNISVVFSKKSAWPSRAGFWNAEGPKSSSKDAFGGSPGRHLGSKKMPRTPQCAQIVPKSMIKKSESDRSPIGVRAESDSTWISRLFQEATKYNTTPIRGPSPFLGVPATPRGLREDDEQKKCGGVYGGGGGTSVFTILTSSYS